MTGVSDYDFVRLLTPFSLLDCYNFLYIFLLEDASGCWMITALQRLFTPFS